MTASSMAVVGMHYASKIGPNLLVSHTFVGMK